MTLFLLLVTLTLPNLEPEIKTEWEIGGDFRFFDDKVSLGVTYYDNIIEGILLDVSLSPSTGFSTQYGNYGEMTNKGMEIDLGVDLIDTNDFGLSTSVNWSTNENEVTDLYGTESINLSPGASVSSTNLITAVGTGVTILGTTNASSTTVAALSITTSSTLVGVCSQSQF